MAKKKSVKFSIYPDCKDAHRLKEEVEALAPKKFRLIVIDCIDGKGCLILGETDRATYERLFSAKLKYQTNIRGSRQVNKWVEIKPAVVPVQFSDRIEEIVVGEWKLPASGSGARVSTDG